MDTVLLAEHAAQPATEPVVAATARSSTAYWVLLAVVPLLAWTIFITVSDPGLSAIRGAEALMTLSAEDQAAELQRWREKLESRVDQAPQDSKSWYLLGHARLKLNEFSGAAEAFSTTHGLVGNDISVQIYWLQSRYLAARGQVDEVSYQLAQDILKAHPNNPVVLEILALHAFSQNDPATAISLLNRAISGASDLMQQASFGRAIEQIRQGMTDAPIGVQVTVGVPSQHATNIPHGGALFVIARPIGGGMPYAVVRRPAILMPMSVQLDDLVTMSPERKLSDAQDFEVVVRMSHSGNAMPEADDWQWVSEPLSLTSAQSLALSVELVPPA